MSNIKKTLLYTTIYNVGFMFCSGAIIQTFLLQAGFSEKQVYLFNSLIQIAQVVMMVVMTVLSSRIKRVKLVTGVSYLSLSLLAIVFLLGAINKDLLGETFVVVTFFVAGITNLGVGIYTIMSYCLPYYTIDMAEYGKMSGLGVMFSGGCSFILSFVHTFVVSKFDYMQSMVWFFILAIICFILTSIICLSMKEIGKQEREESSKEDVIAVFKNKDTYALLIPNFARGLAAGIMSVITVVAISMKILDEQSSSLVNVIMQIAMFAGNFIYIFAYKKLSSKNLLVISTIGICVSLPFCVMGGNVWFLVLFFLAYLFRMIVDTAIPVLVTEIIPQNQIGAFTSIRMLVFTGAQAVATLIIMPIVGVVGYNGLMIFAVVMQAICGAGYFLCAHFKKKENKQFNQETV